MCDALVHTDILKGWAYARVRCSISTESAKHRHFNLWRLAIARSAVLALGLTDCETSPTFNAGVRAEQESSFDTSMGERVYDQSAP